MNTAWWFLPEPVGPVTIRNAFRPRHHQTQSGERFGRQVRTFERDDRALAIQNPQHDILAVHRRLGGNAKVDWPPGKD